MPFEPFKSNCLLWAIIMRYVYGGKIKVRISRNGPWPHWLWQNTNGSKWSYCPKNPKKIPYDFLWFEGTVKREY